MRGLDFTTKSRLSPLNLNKNESRSLFYDHSVVQKVSRAYKKFFMSDEKKAVEFGYYSISFRRIKI